MENTPKKHGCENIGGENNLQRELDIQKILEEASLHELSIYEEILKFYIEELNCDG